MQTFAQKPRTSQPTASAKASTDSRGHVGQAHDSDSILNLQRTIGNQAVLRLCQSNAEERNALLTGTTSTHLGYDFSRIPVTAPKAVGIQAKLEINKPGDEYEQEADRVADQVMRMPDPKQQHTYTSGGECPRGQIEHAARKEAQTKRTHRDASGETAAPAIVHDLGSGVPLDSGERASLEARFSADFSQIRIHHDSGSDHAAELINARAFTFGNHIAFRAGLRSQSASGRRLLAHELTHVLQQRGGGETKLGLLSAAPVGVARESPPETGASVQQRMLNGMIALVKQHPTDDEARLEALVGLFKTVPDAQVAGLYHRLEPGAKTDDFAQYFKQKYPRSRAEGLAYLRGRAPTGKAAIGSKSGPAMPGPKVGESIAAAGCSLPSNESGKPLIRFGQSMSGDGYTMNPKYWFVEYTLVKGKARRTFTATADKSAWRQTEVFLEGHDDWHGTTLDIVMRVGKYGAADAIKDVYNVSSSSLYTIDCLAASKLVQLRGIHLSYPEVSRDADFDRDYRDFAINLFGDETKVPTTSLDKDLNVTILAHPVALKDYAAVNLQPGDQVPISNPYMPPGPWTTENTVYVGEGRFFGHPFGVLTIRGYAEKLAAKLNKEKPFEERVQFVLNYSKIESYSRPKTRAARAGEP